MAFLQIANSHNKHPCNQSDERKESLYGPSWPLCFAEHCRWLKGRNLLWADPLFRNHEEQSANQAKVIPLLMAAAEYRRGGEMICQSSVSTSRMDQEQGLGMADCRMCLWEVLKSCSVWASHLQEPAWLCVWPVLSPLVCVTQTASEQTEWPEPPLRKTI